MVADCPSGWEREERRSYTPAGSDREIEYRTYRHESGDLRLRVAPAALDGEERPGYALRTITYPGLEFSESTPVRYLLTFARCDRLARRFMSLFDGVYDGPGSLEAALEYATARTAADAVIDRRGE